jgi:hypothetical protein
MDVNLSVTGWQRSSSISLLSMFQVQYNAAKWLQPLPRAQSIKILTTIVLQRIICFTLFTYPTEVPPKDLERCEMCLTLYHFTHIQRRIYIKWRPWQEFKLRPL